MDFDPADRRNTAWLCGLLDNKEKSLLDLKRIRILAMRYNPDWEMDSDNGQSILGPMDNPDDEEKF